MAAHFPTAWYSPTTLFTELAATCAWRSEKSGMAEYGGVPPETAVDVDRLLRGVMDTETIADIGDAQCLECVRALTMRACNALAHGDTVQQVLTQKQLASALLRWVILRPS